MRRGGFGTFSPPPPHLRPLKERQRKMKDKKTDIEMTCIDFIIQEVGMYIEAFYCHTIHIRDGYVNNK